MRVLNTFKAHTPLFVRGIRTVVVFDTDIDFPLDSGVGVEEMISYVRFAGATTTAGSHGDIELFWILIVLRPGEWSEKDLETIQGLKEHELRSTLRFWDRKRKNEERQRVIREQAQRKETA